MFLKLLKHELYAAGRSLLPVFAGLLLMAGLARGSVWMMERLDTKLSNILGWLIIGLFVLFCVAVVVSTVILMILRFARTVHGDEGYLTHTLPTGVHSILITKLLTAFLAILASFVAVWLGYKISTAGIRELSELGKFIVKSLRDAGVDTTATLWRLLGTVAASLLVNTLRVAAAITIGHSFSNGKVGKSVLFYFVLAAAENVLTSLILVMTMGLLESGAAYSVQASGAAYSVQVSGPVGNTLILSICINVILSAFYYFLTWLLTKRKLNLA